MNREFEDDIPKHRSKSKKKTHKIILMPKSEYVDEKKKELKSWYSLFYKKAEYKYTSLRAAEQALTDWNRRKGIGVIHSPSYWVAEIKEI